MNAIAAEAIVEPLMHAADCLVSVVLHGVERTPWLLRRSWYYPSQLAPNPNTRLSLRDIGRECISWGVLLVWRKCLGSTAMLSRVPR
jgi:hypothetical protein